MFPRHLRLDNPGGTHRLFGGSFLAKRAETRPCPVCEELIPLRLMAVHLDLELQRVEEIVKAVGSSEVLYDDQEEGYVHLHTTKYTRTYTHIISHIYSI